jgi:hypothetical protein
MRELSYLINDVREQTDNEDINGVSDKEIIRYFNDGVKSIQAIVFKNNPLCSYFQKSVIFQSPVAGMSFDLPSDCYAFNAVSFVEALSDASINDLYMPLERCFQEDQNNFQGWFTRNKQVVFTGTKDISIGYQARAWYFYRLPKFDKIWATVASRTNNVITLNVLDDKLLSVDNRITVVDDVTREVKATNLLYVVNSTIPTYTITIRDGDFSRVGNDDFILMGGQSSLDLDLPDEVEPYLLDYVAKRIYSRNNYALDASKIDFFTADDRANITAIFADASQSLQRSPITDTSFMMV